MNKRVFSCSLLFALTLVLAIVLSVRSYSVVSALVEDSTEDDQEAMNFSSDNRAYKFKYPNGWIVSAENDAPFALTQISIDNPNNSERYLKIEIVTLSNNERLSLDEWISRFMKKSYSQPSLVTSKDTEIGGYAAKYQIEEVISRGEVIRHPIIYLERDGYILLVNASRVDQQLEGLMDQITNSLEFETGV